MNIDLQHQIVPLPDMFNIVMVRQKKSVLMENMNITFSIDIGITNH